MAVETLQESASRLYQTLRTERSPKLITSALEQALQDERISARLQLMIYEQRDAISMGCAQAPDIEAVTRVVAIGLMLALKQIANISPQDQPLVFLSEEKFQGEKSEVISYLESLGEVAPVGDDRWTKIQGRITAFYESTKGPLEGKPTVMGQRVLTPKDLLREVIAESTLGRELIHLFWEEEPIEEVVEVTSDLRPRTVA